MSAKHRDPLYRTNARIIRQQVARARRIGDDVCCQRCGRIIREHQTFDVGHRNASGGNDISNLAPEHRMRRDCALGGNRSHGGKLGAAITNRRRSGQPPGLLKW
ncbi:hypothetical protein [Microbacterium schleiferi]|uniref:HNH endonuclease n=1 Tax=Microbacterium schleiferi TaxID=69362 RepID=A0ABU7V9F5_9MICO